MVSWDLEENSLYRNEHRDPARQHTSQVTSHAAAVGHSGRGDLPGVHAIPGLHGIKQIAGEQPVIDAIGIRVGRPAGIPAGRPFSVLLHQPLREGDQEPALVGEPRQASNLLHAQADPAAALKREQQWHRPTRIIARGHVQPQLTLPGPSRR
jgi:hypothetical protein